MEVSNVPAGDRHRAQTCPGMGLYATNPSGVIGDRSCPVGIRGCGSSGTSDPEAAVSGWHLPTSRMQNSRCKSLKNTMASEDTGYSCVMQTVCLG